MTTLLLLMLVAVWCNGGDKSHDKV